MIVPQDINPGASVSGLRQDKTQPESRENKLLSQVLPNTKILSRLPVDRTRSGFTFFLPPIEALEFPPELIRILKDFLEKYLNDLMTLRTCLIACYIFKQAIEHSDMLMERFMQMRRAKGGAYQLVPEIRPVACLIYTPHWLRFPEYMGLTEYLHPFRFIYRELDTDYAYLGE